MMEEDKPKGAAAATKRAKKKKKSSQMEEPKKKGKDKHVVAEALKKAVRAKKGGGHSVGEKLQKLHAKKANKHG